MANICVKIILNLDRCHLNNFLSKALAAILFEGIELFVQVWLGYYGGLSCEIILDLDQFFICRLKAFLRKFFFLTLVTILFGREIPFAQFC